MMKTITLMMMVTLAMTSCQQQQVQNEKQTPIVILPIKK